MAAASNTSPAGFLVFVLLSVLVSEHVSPASAQTDEKAGQCTDGFYPHDGRNCCLCAAGLHLVEHCTTALQYGQCAPCEPETYTSHPNEQMFCDRCTSCSQINADLEVDQHCTPARDTKCRCQKNHYCGTENCIFCYPCKKCGDEGSKVDCVGNNDTICNVKREGGNHVGTIVGITVLIVLLIIAGVAYYFWRKRDLAKKQQTPGAPLNGNAHDVEMQCLTDVDLQPHLPDIAEQIGWKVMKNIAIRSKIPFATIESCKLDHRDDCQEQTLKLLRIWVEKHGRNASRLFIEYLHKSGKKDQAEQVIAILSRGS